MSEGKYCEQWGDFIQISDGYAEDMEIMKVWIDTNFEPDTKAKRKERFLKAVEHHADQLTQRSTDFEITLEEPNEFTMDKELAQMWDVCHKAELDMLRMACLISEKCREKLEQK